MQKTTKTVPGNQKNQEMEKSPKNSLGVQKNPKPCKCRQWHLNFLGLPEMKKTASAAGLPRGASPCLDVEPALKGSCAPAAATCCSWGPEWICQAPRAETRPHCSADCSFRSHYTCCFAALGTPLLDAETEQSCAATPASLWHWEKNLPMCTVCKRSGKQCQQTQP